MERALGARPRVRARTTHARKKTREHIRIPVAVPLALVHVPLGERDDPLAVLAARAPLALVGGPGRDISHLSLPVLLVEPPLACATHTAPRVSTVGTSSHPTGFVDAPCVRYTFVYVAVRPLFSASPVPLALQHLAVILAPRPEALDALPRHLRLHFFSQSLRAFTFVHVWFRPLQKFGPEDGNLVLFLSNNF